MLPNGILGILSNDTALVERFLAAHRHRCSDGQTLRIETPHCGGVVLGSAISQASSAATHFSRSDDDECIGVFNGVAFDDWAVERNPHSLAHLSTQEIDSGANGMFLTCAADDNRLTLITDPWGTLPVYTHESKDAFAFSSSLHALAESMITDIALRNGGG